jgi:hypothetical protein
MGCRLREGEKLVILCRRVVGGAVAKPKRLQQKRAESLERA